MIALLGSVVLAAASATPPPTIIRERVSPVCSTLHQLAIPLAQMNIKNRPILQNVRTLQYKLAQARRTRLGDGVFLYASQIDQAFSNIIQNINEVDRALLKSYAAYPQGQNRKVDALRQRAQNVADLERVMANARAASFAATVDNDDSVPFGSLPAGPDEASASPARPAVVDDDPRLDGTVPAGFSLRMLKWTGLPELQSLLHREGAAFETQTLIAAHDCDGA